MVQGDLTDYASLKKAVNDTANITGGALDYVIANAADMSVESGFYPIGVLYVDLLDEGRMTLTD
jgi:hypothetical protein